MKIEKRFYVKVVDLSEDHGIYINGYMRSMENDDMLYEAVLVNELDKIYLVDNKYYFHEKHLEIVPIDETIFPEPQLFDVKLLDI